MIILLSTEVVSEIVDGLNTPAHNWYKKITENGEYSYPDLRLHGASIAMMQDALDKAPDQRAIARNRKRFSEIQRNYELHQAIVGVDAAGFDHWTHTIRPKPPAYNRGPLKGGELDLFDQLVIATAAAGYEDEKFAYATYPDSWLEAAGVTSIIDVTA